MSKSKVTPEIKNHFKQELEKLESQLRDLSVTLKGIKDCGLNIDVVAYVIQKSAQPFNKTYAPIPLATIKSVLKGIENVEEYLGDLKGWE